jgi:3-dehydroquinate synthase
LSAPPAVGDPLWVRTLSRTYPIYVGQGVTRELGALLSRHELGGTIRVIADERVAALHGAAIRAAIEPRSQSWYFLPAGEEHKTLEQVERLYDALLADRPERGDVILALGGGVTGDMAGFVAATLLRGIPFVQVPTTLLSHVDSSVGGKVGVDHPRGKNLIGAFHQPSLVVADSDLLRTLPPREIAAGWAEVVKIAVIQDAELFADLEAHADKLRNLEPGPTVDAIRRAISLKARVVEQDEYDLTGLRAILNYGHTIGHALEAATGYATLLHGEAVAVGMRAAASIAVGMGLHLAEASERQTRLLRRLGLPQASPETEPDKVRAAMGLDKKRSGGRVAWILPTGLGAVQVTRDVPDDLVTAAIDLVTRAA